MTGPTHYTLRQLEQMTGTPARTLRLWIKRKLLPKPIGRGRATRYDQEHLVRAQAVAALRHKREPVNTIRRQLAELSDDQLRALAPVKPRKTDTHGVPVPPPEPAYPARSYEVVHVMNGLWLMVDTSNGPLPRRVANEIYRHYAMPASAP